jgi:hypothetical protein
VFVKKRNRWICGLLSFSGISGSKKERRKRREEQSSRQIWGIFDPSFTSWRRKAEKKQ